MRYDYNGLIVKDDGDGGDTARNQWSAFIGAGVGGYMPMKLFNADCTVLVRHPKQGIFWSDPKETSRDQTLHAFTYLAAVDPAAFRRFHWAHAKRLYQCQNSDTMLGSLNVITRASGDWLLYPVTVLWDFTLLLGVMERCHWLPRWDQDKHRFTWANDPDDVGDDLNLQMSLIQNNHPSPVRYLARLLYKYCRPATYGNNMPDCINTAHGCWLWYYRNEARNDLFMPDFWREQCRKYF